MLYRHPGIGGELLNRPLTAESANAAVVLSTKGIVGTVVQNAAIDMRHPCLNAQGKTQATSLIGREDGTGEPVRGVTRDPQRLRVTAHFDDGRHGPPGMFNTAVPGDTISHDFQCTAWGRAFKLFADTYQGRASWTVGDRAKAVGDVSKPN